jgi:solute carrier family 35 protein E3
MCVGVTVATVNDVQVEPFGLFIGLLAIMGAVQQQILIGKMQKELGASANQLLVAYTPYAYTVLFIISPIDLMLPDNSQDGFAAYNKWIDGHLTAASGTTIVLSGCLGLLVSLSTYLLIGHTSALTYNIVGHLKTCCILASGWIFFAEPMSMGKFLGIGTALVGVIW